MPKYPPLKVIRMVSFDEGKSFKSWNDCTEAEKQAAADSIGRKLANSLQSMIDRDPMLWDKLCEKARTEHPEWITG